MLNINDKTTIFVKGFAQDVDYDVLMNPSDCHGEFIAVITDLVSSGYVKITSATMNDGKWILEGSDGEVRTLEQEPNALREMTYGKLVTNFFHTFRGNHYDVIFPVEYNEVIKAIASGDKSYRLVGYIDRREIVTSSLVKFWTDSNGKNHGMTMSGSHYIF